MDIKGFFSDDEVEQIKNKVIERLVGESLLDVSFVVENGEHFTEVRLKPQIDSVVREETKTILKEYVHKVADETIRPKVSEAADMMADRLVKQFDEITNKINWYFSIK